MSVIVASPSSLVAGETLGVPNWCAPSVGAAGLVQALSGTPALDRSLIVSHPAGSFRLMSVIG